MYRITGTVIHLPAATEFQQSILVQRVGDVIAAFAGVNHCSVVCSAAMERSVGECGVVHIADGNIVPFSLRT